MFDTVLSRRVGGPEAVFDLLVREAAGDGPLAGVPSPAFTVARLRAEEDLHAATGTPPTLDRVYAEVCRRLGLAPADAAVLVDEEEQVERRLSVLVPGAGELLEQARGQVPGGALLFVSDTPHRPELLRELLDRAGAWREGDRLYCSGDRGATKAEGSLFGVVARDLGASPADVLHVGDNLRSDVASAQVEGWQARVRGRGRLNRYEELWELEEQATDGLGSWLSGSSRLARLEAEVRGVPAGTARVAAGVVGPLLLAQSLWLVQQTRRRGLRRLYFVARDGEVMLEAARRVFALLAPDVELRYLYGSRQAWEFPGLAVQPATLREWVTVQKGFTARAVLARVGLTTAELDAPDGPPGLSPSRADAPLGEGDRRALADWLQRPEVAERVLERARQAATAVGAYLDQEGFADDVPTALVDLGWRGHTARAFDALLASRGLPAVRHLFLGLTPPAGAVRSSSPAPDLTGWLFDLDRGTGVAQAARVAGLVTALESFCAGTEGRCLGYEVRDGGAHPVLAAPANGPVLAWGLPEFRRVLLRVVELVAPELREAHLHVDLTDPLGRALELFWTAPDDEELRSWAGFPYEDETWPPYQPLAPRISVPDVLRRVARGDRNLRPVQSWRAGTARVSAQPWRALLLAREWEARAGLRYGRIPRRVRLELAARRTARDERPHLSSS